LTGLRRARMGWDRRGDPLFHWRGGEVTRLEGFSDAVFGFALTLLVVSLEVPKNFDDLSRVLRGALAFAICFAMLVDVWHKHYRFFRRYGLQDGVTLALNAALLFVVVLYVYPLKFVMTSFVDSIVLGGSTLDIRLDQIGPLFAIYGLGFAAVFLFLAALYGYAFRRRDELELDELERFLTRGEVIRNLLFVGLGGFSIALAYLLPLRLRGLAGYSYALIGLVETWHGARVGAGRKRFAEQREAGAAPAESSGGAG
jgi:uncharacterized membrane protein